MERRRKRKRKGKRKRKREKMWQHAWLSYNSHGNQNMDQAIHEMRSKFNALNNPETSKYQEGVRYG